MNSADSVGTRHTVLIKKTGLLFYNQLLEKLNCPKKNLTTKCTSGIAGRHGKHGKGLRLMEQRFSNN